MTERRSGAVRVLLVDDHPVVRAGLRFVLEHDERLEVAGELRPDVVFMDVSMPIMDGLEATRLIKQRSPDIRVLIVSTHSDDEYALGALESGADGYLLKQCRPRELSAGVLQVCAGDRVVHHSLLGTLINKAVHRPAPGETLSEREREVLQMLAEGATSKEIAVALGLKPKTVENHRARILDKLGVANSAAAVRAALAAGLVATGVTPRRGLDAAASAPAGFAGAAAR